MKRIKRWVLVGFVLLWLGGVLLTAPAPLYRWLYLQANQLPLDTPHQLFEGLNWTHPHYYADLGRAFRALSQEASTNAIYLYIDLESDINTDAYRRYFSEYADVWAYPIPVNLVGNLANVPSDATVIISSSIAPELDCRPGVEHLFLCQS